MIRRAIMLVAVAGAVTAALVASSAIAGNTPSPSADASPCPVGGPASCFAPLYTAVGQAAKYTGPAASTVSFADCCLAGDTYKGKAGGQGNFASVKWTSSGTQDSACSGFPHPDTHSLTIAGGATKAQLKMVASPFGGGGAYAGMDAAGWVQTQGIDVCGF